MHHADRDRRSEDAGTPYRSRPESDVPRPPRRPTGDVAILVAAMTVGLSPFLGFVLHRGVTRWELGLGVIAVLGSLAALLDVRR